MTDGPDQSGDDIDPSDSAGAAALVKAARLRQNETLESVGRLAGGIAHDFNNLLTTILGYAELLDKQLRFRNLSAERRDLQEIRIAAERARDLTHRLLAFSRGVPARPRLIELRQVVIGMEPSLRRLMPPRIVLVFEVTEEPGTVVADPTQMEQVLLSLAVNACDAMPEGGLLTIALDGREISDAARPAGHVIGATDVRHGSYVELRVADTGGGMSADIVHRAFEPFFTTKSSSQGLGLSAVYGLVTRASGVVVVDSALGVGTTVRVLMPRAAESADGDVAQPELDARGGTQTILLADDDAAVLALNARTLRDAGYEVFTAENGNVAVEIASRPGLHLDILITDIVMPGRNGWEVAEAIQADRPEILVLYISGFAPASLTPSHLPEEGIPFLAKPFTPSTLLIRVRQLIDAAPKTRE